MLKIAKYKVMYRFYEVRYASIMLLFTRKYMNLMKFYMIIIIIIIIIIWIAATWLRLFYAN